MKMVQKKTIGNRNEKKCNVNGTHKCRVQEVSTSAAACLKVQNKK